ncbi:MAG: thiamine phosphate synthase [Candidatus Krumholzibacteriota bacterium]|nr:thiamine phosphate synthase [Candidatus Krumholzibacteriota bacterium]
MINEKEIIFRILDANVNRCCEGLRVIEEVARFGHDDSSMMLEIKEIRHSIRRIVESMSSDAPRFRRSDEDVGGLFSTESEKYRSSFQSVTRANFLRVEESLRVIEEFGKLIDPEASGPVKNLRFRIYTIEKIFLHDKRAELQMPDRRFLYAFVDRSLVSAEDVEAVTEDLAAGGAKMIQYRAKSLGRSEMRKDLMTVLAVAGKNRIPVIVNDDVYLAAETGADGVHVGKCDMAPAEIREILGPGSIVGLSINSAEELECAPVRLLDYLAVSGVFPTETKEGVEVLGLEFLKEVCGSSSLPVVAIGGINLSNVSEVIGAGAAGIAVISAVLKGDVRKNSFTFSGIIDKKE